MKLPVQFQLPNPVVLKGNHFSTRVSSQYLTFDTKTDYYIDERNYQNKISTKQVTEEYYKSCKYPYYYDASNEDLFAKYFRHYVIITTGNIRIEVEIHAPGYDPEDCIEEIINALNYTFSHPEECDTDEILLKDYFSEECTIYFIENYYLDY